jgi:3',5'-cyclic AMP phosphodiesterase CpdA
VTSGLPVQPAVKRCWLLAPGLAVLLLLAIGCRVVSSDPKVLHLVNSQNQSATIQVSGARTNLKFMQITDAHISLSVAGETNMMQYAERMHKAYTGPRRHFRQDTSKTTFEYLDDVLRQARKDGVELLLLTGDIVNFPSAASVDYVCARLKETGIPWLYIAGNHDWHYEGFPGSLDALRKTWTEKSLLPLYQGRNPLYYSQVIKGINFVGIDNSTGKVSQQQVDFLKAQLQRTEPIIVLSHIPYNFTLQGGRRGLDPFVQTMLASRGKVVGVFAGHSHQFSLSFSGNLCQYVSLPCFQGACFEVEVKPALPGQ